jgi:putative glutamine amidotransferase
LEVHRRPGKTHALKQRSPVVAETTQATQTAVQTPERPKATIRGAQGASSVGGRALPGPVRYLRLPGRNVDVMLPANIDFRAYTEALTRSGAFTAQSKQLASLASMSATPAPEGDVRPIVGIVLSEPFMLLKDQHPNTENLIALVEAMGCRAVLIPPCADLTVAGGATGRARAWAAMASQLDGLVGPGGPDVDPSIYGEANTGALNTNLLRDTFEAGFVKVALDCDLFAFGICRSHQLWNAAAGGKLIQDVQDEGVTSVSHREGFHPLMVKRGSMLFEATRQEAMRVNIRHHQAVDQAGWGFRVVGRTHDLGTGKDMIEATERWNGITTQYHPENMQEDPAQRHLFASVGRRAHVFALLKGLRRQGPVSMQQLIERMKAEPRYDESDLAWARRELSRRLSR